jgi:hypothetical protein
MRGVWITAAFGVGVLLAGCVIITGGTDSGYTTQASSTSTCLSASDCVDAGGGVCCVVPAAATASVPITTACMPGPCQLVQLCLGNSECNDGGINCVPQSCKVTITSVTPPVTSSVPFQACGLFNCSSLP